jgi:hypothetical protein
MGEPFTQITQEREGNTKPLSLNQRSRKWIFVLNNWDEHIYTKISRYFAIKECKYIIGKEIGSNGTPHLQGYVNFKDAVSFKSLKNLCNEWHLEKAKGSDIENYNYASKDGDFISNITLPKPLIGGELTLEWQLELKNTLINTNPDFRTIYWYWSEGGSMGKSTFIRHMLMYHNCAIINKGNYSDMINQIYNIEIIPNIILVDIPRNMHRISYSALEDIKNGVIANSKYETGYKVFNPPHIVVFCNFECDDDVFSEDRLIVRNLDENENKNCAD